MTSPPPPVEYQASNPLAPENGTLKTISILHFVWGGLVMLFSCFAIIYIVMGILMLNGNSPFRRDFAPPPTSGPAMGPPIDTIGYMLTGMGSCGLIFGWGLGILSIISGRRILQRRSRVFSIVVAAVNCISFPFGTALGVCTIVVLSKERVKALYGTDTINPG